MNNSTKHHTQCSHSAFALGIPSMGFLSALQAASLNTLTALLREPPFLEKFVSTSLSSHPVYFIFICALNITSNYMCVCVYIYIHIYTYTYTYISVYIHVFTLLTNSPLHWQLLIEQLLFILFKIISKHFDPCWHR